MVDKTILQSINAQRSAHGFLTIEELLSLTNVGNVVLDPFSTLISGMCAIGDRNVFYPNTVITCTVKDAIRIGDKNIWYPGCFFLADQGTIVIGNGNSFGDRGCTIKANQHDAHIQVGDNGRYADGATILGKTDLGSGSQILGNITVQHCTLAEGLGFTAPDPDERGAVLKGYGVARGLHLQKGEVINGRGTFDQKNVERQSIYHSKPV